MRKIDAVRFFGTQTELAKALGISQAAVSKWPEQVPELQAYKLQVITAGKLQAYTRERKQAPANA